MAIDYNNCNYVSTDFEANKKHANLWWDFWHGQIWYICNKMMIIARRSDAQDHHFSKTIHKIFLEEICILLPKLDQTTRSKRGILEFIFKVITDIASEAVPAFIKYRKNNSLWKSMIAIGNQQNFQVNVWRRFWPCIILIVPAALMKL